jgi:hypothetical protein
LRGTIDGGTIDLRRQGAHILIDHPASKITTAWVDTGTVASDTVKIRSRFPSIASADSVAVLRFLLRHGR